MAIEITSSQAIPQASRGGRGAEAPARSKSVVSEAVTVPPLERNSSPGRPVATESGEAVRGDLRQGSSKDPESLAKVVEMVNEQPQIRNRSLQFSVDDSTGKMLVRVYDAETDELIRQFPPDELLALAERIQDVLADDSMGLMLQEKA